MNRWIFSPPYGFIRETASNPPPPPHPPPPHLPPPPNVPPLPPPSSPDVPPLPPPPTPDVTPLPPPPTPPPFFWTALPPPSPYQLSVQRTITWVYPSPSWSPTLYTGVESSHHNIHLASMQRLAHGLCWCTRPEG